MCFSYKEMIYFLRQAQDKLLAQRYISNTNYFSVLFVMLKASQLSLDSYGMTN